ncbi:hypothetical protein CLF_112605 [Clonorchis sinensis]|uniref:Uncharacterized protein n=1 Tax=Clonorchis sinensis TaxID=79923 RepID=G7YML9_CLOSI|nr:hypothetical protein CLF_112605 [Clonorchis sinensis]
MTVTIEDRRYSRKSSKIRKQGRKVTENKPTSVARKRFTRELTRRLTRLALERCSQELTDVGGVHNVHNQKDEITGTKLVTAPDAPKLIDRSQQAQSSQVVTENRSLAKNQETIQKEMHKLKKANENVLSNSDEQKNLLDLSTHLPNGDFNRTWNTSSLKGPLTPQSGDTEYFEEFYTEDSRGTSVKLCKGYHFNYLTRPTEALSDHDRHHHHRLKEPRTCRTVVVAATVSSTDDFGSGVGSCPLEAGADKLSPCRWIKDYRLLLDTFHQRKKTQNLRNRFFLEVLSFAESLTVGEDKAIGLTNMDGAVFTGKQPRLLKCLSKSLTEVSDSEASVQEQPQEGIAPVIASLFPNTPSVLRFVGDGQTGKNEKFCCVFDSANSGKFLMRGSLVALSEISCGERAVKLKCITVTQMPKDVTESEIHEVRIVLFYDTRSLPNVDTKGT